MKKRLFAAILVAMLITTGCNSGNSQNSASLPMVDTEASQLETPSINEPEEESLPETEEDLANDLVLDEYDGLEITAGVLIRRSLLPGTSIPVNVKITNNGDETIHYTQGSGSFEVPQALIVEIDGLQTVRPRDHLGMMTMDFVTNELKPGETLEFDIEVMAIQPHEEFDNYTNELYGDDEQTYIAEMDWEALQERYPDLVAAEPGSYDGSVIFQYTLPDEDDGDDILFGGPTGYAKADLQITVDE